MTSVAGWITAISVLVIAVALTVGIVVGVLMIKRYLDKFLTAAEPAIKRTEETMKTVSEIAETVRARTDRITGVVEDTMEDVSQKVKTTSTAIHETIKPPLASVAAMLAGIWKGLQVWNELSRRKGGDSRG